MFIKGHNTPQLILNVVILENRPVLKLLFEYGFEKESSTYLNMVINIGGEKEMNFEQHIIRAC